MSIVSRVLAGSFVAGATFIICALLVPATWYLAALPSFATGYLAYNFAAISFNIPIAWRTAVNQTQGVWQRLEKKTDTLNGYWQAMIDFFEARHPFWYPSLVLAFVVTTIGGLWPACWRDMFLVPNLVLALFLPLVCLWGTTLTSIFMMIILALLAGAGLAPHNKYFLDLANNPIWVVKEQVRKQDMIAIEATYWNVLGYSLIGLGLFIRWPFLLLGRCLYLLIRLTHSSERTLCGTAGVIGGGLTYYVAVISLNVTLASPVAIFLLILNGGLAGALVGYLDWRFVRPSLMRLLEPKMARATT